MNAQLDLIDNEKNGKELPASLPEIAKDSKTLEQVEKVTDATIGKVDA